MTGESFLDGKVQLLAGDCLDVLKSLPPNSVDSIVTDPPYGLEFMGKGWDGADGFRRSLNKSDADRDSVFGRTSKRGPEYRAGTLFQDFIEAVAVECLRVLKPGAHLIAFGGTRTYHRMACAIEDGGFEIRDCLQWLYGSGFPKSLDVSKAIDKAAGAERVVIRERYTVKRINPGATVVADGEWGKQDIAYTATDSAPATAAAALWSGFGTALKPACEPIVLARKPLIGTVADNVIAHGTGALNIDGCRVAASSDDMEARSSRNGTTQRGQVAVNCYGEFNGDGQRTNIPLGRWPANVIHDGSDEVVGAFPEAPWQLWQSTTAPRKTGNVYGDAKGPRTDVAPRDNGGSAARFFYTAKADADDRLGSKHPTVKPLDLMQYLVRLVTPPGGLVLDPFAGTGTTGEAAWREGMRAVLIEREAVYQEDIRRRMALCLAGPAERKRESIKARSSDKPFEAGTLFA